jgi:tetratricopeptide (TPR) repeat protein
MKPLLMKARALVTFPRVVFVVAPLLVFGTLMAQSRQGGTPADQALRALNEGRYQDVEQILGGQTDARSYALRGRALIEVGRYADAEKLLAGPAKAQPASDAALEFGLLQLIVGRRAEASQTLRRILNQTPRTAADSLRMARAAVALARELSDTQLFKDANDWFRDANRQAQNDAEINAAWGELFLEKYEMDEAMKSFKVALTSDETHVAARLGLAAVLMEQNPPQAKAAIEQALKINPNSVPAHLFVASAALDDRRLDDATTSIEAALKVNPNSLEARSLRAATLFLRGREAEFEQQAQEILKINPTYGDVYRTAGDHLARQYRFDEAVVMTRRALTIDPRNARTHADLGLQLMRTGDEAEARKSLEASFQGDQFQSNLLTKNLLEVLDELENDFETITDGRIVMKLHKSEVGVMREHALPLAKESLAALEKRYNFTAQGPLLIEMFPKHDGFAVRTLGLPGMIGALGACFGRVVTLDSPRARKPGDFSWQETLWHEMAHVITLQMSKNRIPRWLSEGTSVYEERRAGREWGRETDLSYAQALSEGKTLDLTDINRAFSDPRLITIAYYESSLIVEHLIDTYGEPKFHEFIRSYARGLEDEQAFKEVYGTTTEALHKSFKASIEKQYASALRALKRPENKEELTLEQFKALASSNPESFPVQMGLAVRLAGEGKDPAAAIAAAETASKLLPRANGENNPNKFIAQVALNAKDTPRAIRALEDVLKVDHSDIEAARQLVTLVQPLNDPARLEAAYKRVVDVDPFDGPAQAGLGRLALRRKDTATAVRAFRSALATNPADRASAHTDLAEALLAAGQSREAKTETLHALEIAPSFDRALDLLLKINESGG